MKRFLLTLLLTVVMSAPLYADSTDPEVEHLLQFVADSGCTFIRNGSSYDSQEARSHMQRKYDYFKDRVSNAEGFIRYAATESSFSGRKYQVTCNDKTLPSGEWLAEELKRYREQER